MTRKLWIRVGLVAFVAVMAAFYLYPPRKTINLGLDLQGGIHLVLGVDIDKALQVQTERAGDTVRAALEKKGIAVKSIERRGTTELSVQLASPQAWADAQPVLKDVAIFDVTEADQPAGRLVLAMRPREVAAQREWFVKQGLETIRNRVDQFGVAEPSIQQQGDNRILVQLPGVQDPERAKSLIGKTALLEFKMVDDRVDPAAAAGGSAALPLTDELLYERRVDPETKQERRIPIVVQKKAMLTGADVADAEVRLDQGNQPYVSLTLTPAGGKVFAQVTTDNVGKLM